jgi:hypothetical protein
VNGTLYESSFTTQAFKNVTMTAVVQDSRQPYSGAAQPNGSASITYKWEVLTTTCGGVEVASPTTPSALVSFLDVSSSTVDRLRAPTSWNTFLFGKFNFISWNSSSCVYQTERWLGR